MTATIVPKRDVKLGGRVRLAIIFRYFSLWLCCLAAISCSKKNTDHFDSSFLKLGSPGKTSGTSTFTQQDHLHLIESDQNFKFLDDHGLVEIESPSRAFKIGDIIIGPTANPMLLRVVEVISSSGARAKLKTELGHLADLNRTGPASLQLETTPQWTAPGLSQSLNHGAISASDSVDKNISVNDQGEVQFRNLTLFDLEIPENVNLDLAKISSLGDQFEGAAPSQTIRQRTKLTGHLKAKIIRGAFKVTPTFRLDSEFSGPVPQKMTSRFDSLLSYHFTVEYDFKGKGQAVLSTKLLPTFKLPYIIPGPVPVYTEVRFDLSAGIRVSADQDGKVQVSYRGQYAFAGELSYQRGKALQKSSQSDFETLESALTPTMMGATLSTELFLEPRVSMSLYRVLGPYAYMKPYLRGELKQPLLKDQDDLYIGVSGGLGIQVSEPVFDSQLLALDSGNIFDLHFGLDLLGPNSSQTNKEELELTTSESDAKPLSISTITKEGFVLIHLAQADDPRLTTFELLESSSQGFLIPTRHFPVTGELYYFPAVFGDNTKDRFTFRRRLGDQTSPPIEVHLKISESLIATAKRPRFSRLTNSVEVTSSASGYTAFESRVPQHYFGAPTIDLSESHFHQSPESFLSEYASILSPIPSVQQSHAVANTKTYSFGDIYQVASPFPKEHPYHGYELLLVRDSAHQNGHLRESGLSYIFSRESLTDIHNLCNHSSNDSSRSPLTAFGYDGSIATLRAFINPSYSLFSHLKHLIQSSQPDQDGRLELLDRSQLFEEHLSEKDRSLAQRPDTILIAASPEASDIVPLPMECDNWLFLAHPYGYSSSTPHLQFPFLYRTEASGWEIHQAEVTHQDEHPW